MHPEGFGNSFKQPTEGHWSLWSNVLLCFIGVTPIPGSIHSPKRSSSIGSRACTWNSHTPPLSVLFWESRVRLGWQSGIWKFSGAAEMEAGLAAKGRDSQSSGSRFSGSLLDFRDEMGWCPCLLSLPNPLAQEKAWNSLEQPEEEANRAVTELPPGHTEYMTKM